MAGKPQPIKHGTKGGYMAHWRRGEDACEACKRAWRMYYQKQEGRSPRLVWLRRKSDERAKEAKRARDLKARRDQYNQRMLEDPEFREVQRIRHSASWRAAATRVSKEESSGTTNPTE